jgi:hypothetical protein
MNKHLDCFIKYARAFTGAERIIFLIKLSTHSALYDGQNIISLQKEHSILSPERFKVFSDLFEIYDEVYNSSEFSDSQILEINTRKIPQFYPDCFSGAEDALSKLIKKEKSFENSFSSLKISKIQRF